MKAISIKQPWASLIVKGIKDIENRTWATKYRGRVLIHASAKAFKYTSALDFFGAERHKAIKDKTLYVPKLEVSAIIGSVEIVACVINCPSIWADKTNGVLGGNMFFMKYDTDPIYNWVLANPIEFPEPIQAKGKLNFWDYPNILAEPEEKDGELFCHCQLPVKEINQVTGDARFGYFCRYCGGKWYK